MALNPVDRLLAGYLAFLTLFIIGTGRATTLAGIGMLVMHALFGFLLWLFTRVRPFDRVGTWLWTLYPLLLLLPFYAEIGFINEIVDRATIAQHDAVVQGWEEAIFGGQISYTWIRAAPSRFWSGLLHLAYFAYYPILALPPLWLVARGRAEAARTVLLSTMIAFIPCYLVFILYPVAGPNYAFDHPVGAVREVWSARMVYSLLAGGSSIGAAFPSSHVAATVATTLALWRVDRRAAHWVIIPCVLLVVGTVYAQMHYGIDAIAGLVVGLAAPVVAIRWERARGRLASADRPPSFASVPDGQSPVIDAHRGRRPRRTFRR